MSATTIDLPALHALCTECGDCWLWPGAMVHKRHPVMKIKGKQVYVRRLVWVLKHGKPVPRRMRVSADCNHHACIAPQHVVARTAAQVNRQTAAAGAYSTPAFRAKVAVGRRRNSALTDEAVERIRTGTEPVAQLAQEAGISEAYAYMLRRGRFRRDYSNPFTALL